VFALTLALNAHAQVNVTMQHNDIGRTGQNTNETILTPLNVNKATFGKLFSHSVDGYVYAQPLYVAGVTMGAGTPQAGTTHNVVFIATQHDSVYAFDADTNGGANSSPLWQVTLLDSAHGATAGEKTVPNSDISSADIVPEIGITSTPVIDTSSNTIYVVSKATVGDTTFFQRLHALDITTGQEKFGGPVALAASVGTATNPATGSGSSGGVLKFDPKWENNRPGSLLLNGMVYLGFAAHGDQGPYHGWVLAYNAKTLALTSAFCTSPNGSQGGIWMSGAGLAADVPAGKPFGRMFVATGNGSFDATMPNTNTMSYGDSHVRLDLTNGIMTVEDSFTPWNQAALNGADTDLGAGGVLILPDQTGAHTHLLVQAGKAQSGKAGIVYVVDRDNLGGFNGSTNNDVQEVTTETGNGLWSMPAYWNGKVYIWGSYGGFLTVFSTSGSGLSANPIGTSTFTLGFPGATPSISSNGTANGIVWALQTDQFGSNGSAVLHALDATNVATEFYNSKQNAADAAGGAVKFAVPTVTNGKVYIGTQKEVDVYGLTSGGQQQVATPVINPAGETFTGTLSATITDSTNGATIYYTTDGSTPTTSSTKYTGAIAVSTTETISAIATETGFLTSAVAKQTYTLQTQVLTPTFTPGAGSYTSAQSVTISDATPNSQIYCTTDGTTPAPGAGTTKLYSGAIAVGATATIKAIATAAGLTNSPVASSTYTITLGGTGINFTSGFAASTGSMTFNGSTGLDDTRLQLTNGGLNQAGSAFFNTPVNIQSFTTDFSVQFSNAVGGADGMTFTIQGVGPTALGCGGGGLGYGPDLPANPDPCSGTPIANSVAIKFDFYSNAGEGTDSTGLYQNGASPTTPAIDMTPSGVILSSNDAMAVHLTYNGTTLAMTIVDNVVGKTFTQSWTVNIPGIVGGNSAYVGFTGGSGGLSSSQKVLTWTFTTNGTTQTAATPVITPAAGTYTLPTSVTISDTTAGASIFYTVDGSTPTSASTLYATPIALTGTTTVSAIAVATGFANSAVASNVYTIQAGMPMFTPAPGSYASSQNVTITDSTAGAAIHYTLDGSTPTATSTLYSGPVVVNTTGTLSAIAIAPGLANSAVASGLYTIAASGATATPTFSPVAGTYSSTQNVTISDTTAGATIYYTTDGTTPTTTSTKYVGAILVSSTKTITAMATATGFSNSAVAIATYTINTTDFDFTVANPQLTVARGSQVTDLITVAPKNGFASAVQFSCAVAGPAPMPTCTVTPSPVPPGTTTATLTIVAPAATAMIAPASGPSSLAGMTGMRFAAWIPLALLGLFVFGGVKKQPRRLAWVGCFLVLAFLLAACNGGSRTGSTGGTGQTPQTYTVTVTGTSTAPAAQHTTQITVLVQ
jgi:Legume lectin domain/Chitobiase/beta-hexosaminidase C-terminal domain